jgi:tetratricopeptide (TPR) repeat protein
MTDHNMTGINIDQAIRIASRHHEAGRLHEAEQLYRQILLQQPNHAQAIYQLGLVAHQVGRNDIAIDVIRQAIDIRPDFPEAHYHLGNALYASGQVEASILAYRRSIDLAADFADSHNNLGNALKATGRLEEAAAAYRQAIALRPGLAEAHSNLGDALRDIGQIDAAIAACRAAIALKPDLPEALVNLGNAYRDKGQLGEAVAAYRAAITLKPGDPDAHYNLALALLAEGEYAQGWVEHEWRWKCASFTSPRRQFGRPLWDGRPSSHATLLLHAEQGIGDTIQFIRLLPLAAQRCPKIIIECHPELQRLIKTSAGGCPVVARGQPLPAFDVHCPLLTLPLLLGTTLHPIPGPAPYLHADAQTAEKWRERRAGDLPPGATSRLLQVGLAWAGNRLNTNDRNRSMPLSSFAPLAGSQGVRFHSLQRNEPASPLPGVELTDWTPHLHDFAETAALIANLDLVISVDTAVAHLAGAMGKPVWLLLPFAPDWRWLRDRDDSPWYPSMRLFRQPSPGDWGSVMDQVTCALTRCISRFYTATPGIAGKAPATSAGEG